MTTTQSDQKRARVDVSAACARDEETLQGFQQQLLQHVWSSSDKQELLREIATRIRDHFRPLSIHYFERNESGELAVASSLYSSDGHASDRSVRQLQALCQSACGQGKVELRKQAAPSRIFVGAPVAIRGQGPEAIAAVFSGNEGPRHLLLMQIVASHVVLWEIFQDGKAEEANARDSAVLLELLERIEQAPSLANACQHAVCELQEYLDSGRVVLGLRKNGKGRCRVTAMSGLARFDRRSQAVQSIETALDEAVVRDQVTAWPDAASGNNHGALTHKAACSADDAASAISIPLRAGDGGAVGALLVLDEPDDSAEHVKRFLQAAGPSLATSLAVMQRLEGGRLAKGWRTAGRICSGWKGKLVLAMVALMLAAMAVPLPYKVGCDCQIEPVTKRFVAAPFEGTLEKSLVKPGDLVHRGQVLARMDGREIRWERASVEADRCQAIKRRDAAQATHKYADAEIAKLEMERLDLQLRLLDHRAENLEIRSPVDGVVASGDLDRAEGATLTIGQSLFEIAPLEKMIVEVSVADDEVGNIKVGQQAEVRLDAFPGETWEAQISKIHPRSEIRDDQNVFIAEVALDNAGGILRPGMKGRAKVTAPDRPLGWILFHKPWEFATKKLTW